MSSSRILNNSRLYCHTKYPETEIFFSLVDYHNNYFTSDDPDKIIEFYNGFDNRKQLIKWMKERPKGYSHIRKIEGEKDIVVVITTADFNGKYAIDCRETIFKGLQIIFVESGGREDFYFNYAHNCNTGMVEAIKYNPKWIVLSGDDMIKIEPISKLVDELHNINNEVIDVVYTNPSHYHSTPMFLATPNRFFQFALMIIRPFSKRFDNVLKTYSQLKRFNKKLFFPRYNYNSNLKYKIENLIFFKKIETFTSILSFGIFSSGLIKKLNGVLLDSNYINEMEDIDLSIRIKREKLNSAVINFKIGEYVGSSLGNGGTRTAMVVPGWTYFSYKKEKGQI